MAIRADIPGMGARYFPDGMSEDEIYARIDEEKARLASVRDVATAGMSGFGMAPARGGSSARQEILDTIAGTEAPDYNTLYGGRKISDLSKHPGIDVPIASGPNKGKTSSAFGRYQFLESTWNDQARQLGLKDMSPASQDAAAWNLASQTYRKKTGGDLEADWASGDPAVRRQALSALSSVWTSLPGGIEQARRYGPKPISEGAPEFKLDPRSLPTSDIFKGALARGAESLKGTYLDLIPALGASIFGKDDYAKGQLDEYAQRMASIEEEFPTAFKSYKDPESVGQAFDFAAETVGELGADAVSFLLGAGVGSKLAKQGVKAALKDQIEDRAAKYAATNGLDDVAKAEYADRLMDRAVAGSLVGRAGAGTGMAAASAALNIPETFEQIYQDTGELHPFVASIFGGVKSALDTVVPGHVLSQLSGAGKDRLTAKVLEKLDLLPNSYKKAFIAEAGATAAAEGLTEGAQQTIDNLASKYAGANKDVFDGVIDSMVRGAIGGGVLGSPGAAVEATRYDFAKAQQPGAPDVSATQQAPSDLAPAGGPAGGEVSSVISSDMLDSIGLDKKRNQWVYKNLAEKDLSDPDTLASIESFAGKLEANKRISPDIKAAIGELITTARGASERGDVSGIEAGPAGIGAGVSGELGAGIPPAGAGAPPAAGMEGDTSPLSGLEGGAPAERSALDNDPLHFHALSHVLQTNSGSTSGLARALNVDWARADRILNGLQKSGYVSAPDDKGQRTVTVPDFEEEAASAEGADLETVKARQEAEAQTEEVRKARTIRGLETARAKQRAETAGSQQRQLEAREIQLRKNIRDLQSAAEEATNNKDFEALTQIKEQLNAFESQLADTGKARSEAATTQLREKHPTDETHGYTTDFDLQDAGDQQAVSTLRATQKVKGEAKDAHAYFGKTPVTQHGLANIAYDLVFPTTRYRAQPDQIDKATNEFFEGTGTKQAENAARWVSNNLGPEANAELDRLIQYYQTMKDKTEASDKVRWDEQVIETDTGRERVMPSTPAPSGDLYFRTEEAAKQAPVATLTGEELGQDTGVSDLAYPVHPTVMDALRKGNLAQALLLHANRAEGVQSDLAKAIADLFFGRDETKAQSIVARKIANKLRNTKVQVSLGLIGPNGKPVPGYYDPRTNTVYLDATDGLNSHTMVHEAAHAVFSHVLEDPNNPLTRHLTQILDKVKDSLDTAYGAQDVQEFAAEAWGNQEFRNTLQSINPDGQPHSALDRFFRAVANFFRRLIGRPAKPLASAYDAVDRLLSQIASPAPQNRDSDVLYAPNKAGKYAYRGVDRIINAAPLLNNRQKAALSNAIHSSVDAVGDGILSLLPEHALGDLAERYFPNMSRKFNEYINERSGYEKNLNRMTDPVVELAKRAIERKPQQQKSYDDIVHRSTLAGVDPTKPRHLYKNDAEKLQDWDDLHAEYTKLDKSWQDLYVRMRDGYKHMYEEIKKAIMDRIDATDMNPTSKAKIRADIMAKLVEQGTIDPYFALGRSGNHWMSAMTVDPQGRPLFVVEAFESEFERKSRMQELERAGATDIQPYSSINEIDYRRAPTGSFVNSVLQLMQANKVPEPAVEEMMRLFIATLPETAFAKSMQARKGTAGYDTDSIGVFERKIRNMSHQISNLKFNPKLRNTLDEMREHAVKVGKGGIEARDKDGNVIKDQQGETVYLPPEDNATHVKYLNEYDKRLRYVLNPTKNDIGSILTSTAFHYTLGFNISSALVNLANVPMIVAPYLSGKYAGQNISGALGDATRLFLGSGRKAAIEMIGANGEKVMMDVMPSIGNYDPTSSIGKKYATLVRVAQQYGQLDRSQLYEMISGDTRTGYLAKFNALSGWAFHHGERMNREVTMVAAYNLEMKKLASKVRAGKMTQEQAEESAAMEAIRTAELTNGSIAAASAPRIAQSALGKMLFMYKRYGVSMYYMLYKTFKSATDKALPASERAAARKQLAGIYGMAGLMAGAQGLPLFGALSIVHSLFKDDEDDDLGTATRKYIGDFFYKGPLEYMTNLSIAGRISLNDLIVRDTKEGASATTFSQQVAQALGGPVLGVADRAQRGLSKIAEGHVMRGVEDMLPAALSNPIKAARYGLEGTKTLRGDPITGDVNPWNIAAQAIGFAPADYTRQLEMNARLKGMHDMVVRQASNLKRRYYTASRMGDYEAMRDARDNLIELGTKHPGLGITRGNVDESIAKSMKAQKAATKDMRHGVRYSKKMLKEIQQEEREWDAAE